MGGADWLEVGKKGRSSGRWRWRWRWRVSEPAWAAWSFKQQLILLSLSHQLSSCARPLVVAIRRHPAVRSIANNTHALVLALSAATPAEIRPSLIHPRLHTLPPWPTTSTM